ncbi:MAG: MarR family transcriptional regulator [Treponema sp.]|nr:MarR family transcriptional regulator [Treponema sp.]
MNGNFTDTEYVILENIYATARQNPPLRQRDLAQIARTSLGMTNSILKRLAQKGWISVKKINSRNIQYAVTLEGLNEIMHRSYRYFKRTIKNVAFYKDTIDDIVRKARRKNTTAALLIGSSDLEFIVEHACHRWGLSFLQSADKSIINGGLPAQTLVVYSEDIPASSEGCLKNALFLSELLIKGLAVS